ncbi:MAG: PilZ domain-containing protein [Deltaproteobacteria bacterium]|nr:PilZ domain-containing protein [Deltaproteobacteria bacterium]MBW2018934.1 PilZ domain-containing protein [Deltaproteobacteria bacterium]MBW2073149.1 PilZ domain-containing protein [Deltaproteobacteria bacterium]RLB83768.1 MAG: hypothetical protein DRH17_01020 [Deltaproteobacteria bacterium]
MQEFPCQERREYVRTPLWVDVEFTILDEDEYEAVRRSERPPPRFISQEALPPGEEGQYQADSAFHSNLIDFLIHIDQKLDRILKLLSKVPGLEVPAFKDDKCKGDLFVGKGLDISGAGMSVICDKPIEPGRILRASFMISRFPIIPLVVFGEVVRTTPVQDDGKQRYQVVIKFIDLDEEDKEKIIAYTFQVQRDAIRKKKKRQ